MRSVLLASLRTHTRRYIAAVVAVTIGVAFIVITGTLASSARNGLVAGVDIPYRHADVVVSDIDGERAARLVADAHRRGDRAAVIGWTTQQLRVDDRLLLDDPEIGALAEDPSLRWQDLRAGRFPTRPGEAVADVNAAKSDRVAVGDRIRVGTGSNAVRATVVGLVDTPSATASENFYLPWRDLRRFTTDLTVNSVAYAGPGAATLADRVPGGATVQSRSAFVEDRQTELTNQVNVLAIVLLIFAAIALFVSVLVIANTFSILFAQRSRDFALLRCVGATRRQILRSVRVEALMIGIASAAVGLVAGVVLGRALVAFARSQFSDGTMGAATPSLWWYVGAFLTGVIVTLGAAWLPTRRVTRVSPLAALRPDDGTDLHTTAGRLRLALGTATVVAGVAFLGIALSTHRSLPMVVGGGLTFGGVLLFGPVLVPGLIRLAGGLAGRVAGAPARLATQNAVRNPRRTAATTASLLVGVTLTTAVLTGLASSRGALDDDMDRSYPVDVALTSTGRPLPTGFVQDVRRTSGVAGAVALEGASAEVNGVGPIQVVAARDINGIVRGTPALEAAEPGEIWVPRELIKHGRIGDRIQVTAGDRTATLRLREGEGWGDAAVVTPAALARLTTAPTPRAVWVRAESGVDAEDLAGDLDALSQPAHADLVSNLTKRAWVDLQLDVLTGTVVALLGIAVVIALIGIGNTLGLSVLERGRENALLRALGLTRRQLRATLGTEAVLLSVVATALGTTIGVVFAWVGVQTVVKPTVPVAPLVLPWGQLALVVLVAGLAGLASALLPARRAARITPAAGLALD